MNRHPPRRKQQPSGKGRGRHTAELTRLEAQPRVEFELARVDASITTRIRKRVDLAEGAVVKVTLRIGEVRGVGRIDRLCAELEFHPFGNAECARQAQIEIE